MLTLSLNVFICLNACHIYIIKYEIVIPRSSTCPEVKGGRYRAVSERYSFRMKKFVTPLFQVKYLESIGQHQSRCNPSGHGCHP
jgi:hypothetical protein